MNFWWNDWKQEKIVRYWNRIVGNSIELVQFGESWRWWDCSEFVFLLSCIFTKEENLDNRWFSSLRFCLFLNKLKKIFTNVFLFGSKKFQKEIHPMISLIRERKSLFFFSLAEQNNSFEKNCQREIFLWRQLLIFRKLEPTQ